MPRGHSFDRLAALGSLGRLIGGAIALAYFALMNSELGGGQTFGKRLVKIRVVQANGTPVACLARFSERSCCSYPPRSTASGFPEPKTPSSSSR